jgi:hypothetical protein
MTFFESLILSLRKLLCVDPAASTVAPPPYTALDTATTAVALPPYAILDPAVWNS